MKKILGIFLATGLLSKGPVMSQTFNWAHLPTRQAVNFNISAYHAINAGFGYAYRLSSTQPLFLLADFSVPAGKNLADDYKFRSGISKGIWEKKNFKINASALALFRRYENPYARLLNFGIDLSATGGLYKKHWFLAGNLGFDKAIITHFRHTALYKENFPGVRDGWYEPATGGNVYYGIQTGWSFVNQDLYLKLGKLTQQDFKTTPMLPFYAELGFNLRIGK